MMRRLLAAAVLAIGCSAAAGGTALGADDYTLPFYDPGIHLSYGVDRDARLCRQLAWSGRTWSDCATHYGYVYDNHTGMDYPMALSSPVAAARDGTVVDLFEGYGTQQFGTYGNFVLLSHPDGRRTLYYHLAQNGVRVSVGQVVRAGQWIADSGCSGQCYGAHLHFEMQALSGGRWAAIDPIAEQRFTTNPGRVPFLAAYVGENDPGTVVITLGRTVTHWVEFRNMGGRTWLRGGSTGRILLATWDPALHASPYRAADWLSATVPTALDPSAVVPGAVGRFTFGLRGITVGSGWESYNLLAYALRWFDHDALGAFYIPVIVTKILQ